MPSSFFRELMRRRVIRVAVIYILVSWAMVRVADVMFPALQLPDWMVTLVAALMVLGFPVAMVLAWAFDIGPEGLTRTVDSPGSITPAKTCLTSVKSVRRRMPYRRNGNFVFAQLKNPFQKQLQTPQTLSDVMIIGK